MTTERAKGSKGERRSWRSTLPGVLVTAIVRGERTVVDALGRLPG